MRKQPADCSPRLDEKLSSTLLHSIRGIVWECDPVTFHFSYVSPQAERILGYPPRQWIEEPDFWRSHIHPDDVPWCTSYCREATNKNEDHEFEYRMIAADGAIVWLRDIITVVRSEDGSTSLRGIMVDITQAKLAEMRQSASEELFRLAMQGANDGIWVLHPVTDEVFFSARWKSMLGYTDDELENRLDTWYHLLHPADRDATLALLQDYLEGRRDTFEVEFRLKHKDGHYITVLSRGFLSRDPEGKPDRLAGTHVDISSLRRAEEELYLTKICIDRAPLGIMRFALDGTIMDANEHACSNLGYSLDELHRMSIFDINPELTPARWPDILDRLRTSGSLTFETTHLCKDGSCVPMEITANRLEYQGNEYLFSFEKDITKRTTVEQALRLREHYQRALLDNFPYAVWMKDGEGRFLAANRQLAASLGLPSPKDLVGRTIFDVAPPDLAARNTEADRRVLLSGRTKHAEEQLPVRGENRWFEVFQSPITIDGQAIGTVGCTWDVTERRAMENALKESEERYRRLVELSPDAVFIHTGGKFAYLNPTAVRLLGARKPEELYGRDALDFIHPDQWEAVSQRIANALSQQDNPPIEETLVRLDGSMVPVEMVSVPYTFRGSDSVLAIARDISERKRVQDELVKAQKLESLGVLAGGIAHDFNNILTGILGNISLIRNAPDLSSGIDKRLEGCEKAAIRATELTRQLLTFARGGEPVRKLVDPNPLIRESAAFVLRGSNVRGEISLADNLWTIEADSGQISQVLNNILINATQAMPDGGVVSITAQNEVVGPHNPISLTAGDYIRITVADQGCGISPENLSKIFDPYFTTKQKGSGLGLASVYSIVKRHGGTVRVSSTLAAGSIFAIYLPAVSEKHPGSGPLEKKDDLAGSGSILIMDDEEIIREVATEILESAGYQVESCCDGREVFERIREMKTRYDVIIMDLTVPGGMGGREAAGLILEIDPDAVLIVSSGYSSDPVIANFRQYGFSGSVVKPFSFNSLAGEVQRLIRKST